MSRTLICVVAVGQGRPGGPLPAREMYTARPSRAALFRDAMRYAESYFPGRWYIMTAGHGIVGPDEIVSPCPLVLNTLPDIQCWAKRREAHFARLGLHPDTHRIEAHAAGPYLMALKYGSVWRVSCPVEGLRTGLRSRWYAAHEALLEMAELEQGQ